MRGAVAAIVQDCAGAGVQAGADLRPRLFDRTSGLSVLLDTGAQCSIWPHKYFDNPVVDNNKHLKGI